MKDTKINSMLECTMKKLSELIDVNTVIGKPFKTSENKTIIPICKVTFAYLLGGGDYKESPKLFSKNEDSSFAGGSGAIVSIKPSGFFTEEIDGYKFYQVKPDVTDKIIDTANEIFKKMSN